MIGHGNRFLPVCLYFKHIFIPLKRKKILAVLPVIKNLKTGVLPLITKNSNSSCPSLWFFIFLKVSCYVDWFFHYNGCCTPRLVFLVNGCTFSKG